jgi:hypothetical protein
VSLVTSFGSPASAQPPGAQVSSPGSSSRLASFLGFATHWLLAHVLDGVYPLNRYELPAFDEGLPFVGEQTEATTTGCLQRGGSVACPCEGLYRLGRLGEGLAFGPGADAITRVKETLAALRVVIVT